MITPAIYAKVKAEVIALFGWDAANLSPAQTLRLDCAVAARLALDDLQGKIMRGEAVDPAKMIPLSETLSRLLPPTALAAPPPEADRVDPRETMWRVYSAMRARGELYFQKVERAQLLDQIEALRAELAALRGEDSDTSGYHRMTSCDETKAEPASPRPLPDNVRQLSRPGQNSAPVATPAPPQPPQTCTAEESRRRMDAVNQPIPERIRDTRPQNEPWRDFTHGGAVLHDRWRNNNW